MLGVYYSNERSGTWAKLSELGGGQSRGERERERERERAREREGGREREGEENCAGGILCLLLR